MLRTLVPFGLAALSGSAGIALLVRSARHPDAGARTASRIAGAMALFFALFLGGFATVLATG